MTPPVAPTPIYGLIAEFDTATEIVVAARARFLGLGDGGVAVGAGLAVAIMADISIASEAMRITDGHLRLGVAAGDQAGGILPLLCGGAKGKDYLMNPGFIGGREAGRVGLGRVWVSPGGREAEGRGGWRGRAFHGGALRRLRPQRARRAR